MAHARSIFSCYLSSSFRPFLCYFAGATTIVMEGTSLTQSSGLHKRILDGGRILAPGVDDASSTNYNVKNVLKNSLRTQVVVDQASCLPSLVEWNPAEG
jgi:hypothetical protein